MLAFFEELVERIPRRTPARDGAEDHAKLIWGQDWEWQIDHHRPFIMLREWSLIVSKSDPRSGMRRSSNRETKEWSGDAAFIVLKIAEGQSGLTSKTA